MYDNAQEEKRPVRQGRRESTKQHAGLATSQEVLHLLGNQTIKRLLGRAEKIPRLVRPPGPSPRISLSNVVSRASTLARQEQEEPSSGVLPPIEAEPEAPRVDESGPLAERELRAPDSAGSKAPTEQPTGQRLQIVPDLEFESATGPGQVADEQESHGDSVFGILSSGSRVRQGLSLRGGVFGSERPSVKIDRIKYKKLPAVPFVQVKARVFVDCRWDVQSLGRKNVGAASDAVITKKTWRTAASDLTPNVASDGGRPPRTKFWARDLTARHERFHASDDIGRVKLYVPVVLAWLLGQSVDASKLATDVPNLLGTARNNIVADMNSWYANGGERRAYGDGRAAYQSRADAIRSRAKSEGWAP